MPLTNTTYTSGNICHGYEWLVRNEKLLASLITRLLMGQYRHVQKILASETTSRVTSISTAGIDDLIRKMTPENDTEMYHRDGWVFQMTTWIAAKILDPHIMSSPPQSQSAMKGLDNLFVRTNSNRVTQVIIGEDKATINERSTITSQVWPGIEVFETGHRDHELLNEITPILERNRSTLDVDECLKELLWEQIRTYRVCISVKENQDNKSRRKLFMGYGKVAKGKIIKRRAETFVINDLRQWMDNLCKRIVRILEYIKMIRGEECTTK